jgi:hypothetical protein
MKKCIALFLLFTAVAGICFTEESGENGGAVENRMDLSFYASTRGKMQVNFLPQWKFLFLQGNSPLTSDNNIALKLDAALSPIWAELTGDGVLMIFPYQGS